MPSTCPHNDWLLHILYGSDAVILQRIIFKAAQSIELTHRCAHVTAALLPLLPQPGDSMLILQAKVLIMLDQDESLRAALCAAGPSDIFPTRRPVCPKKATGFFQGLHDLLLPRWIKDEAVTLADFIDEAWMLYLIA